MNEKLEVTKTNLIKLLIHSIDLKGFAFGILDEVLEPALDDLVKGTETTLDDSLKAVLYPILSVKLKELANAKIDELLLKLQEA